VPRYRLPASGTSLARAAAAIAGRGCGCGCGCASSPLAPGTTSYSRIGFAHEYRPLNATWALTYGALRTYWALGHGPRFPTAPADIPVLEGWGIVALCAATLLILSAQSIRSVSTASPATRTRWPAVSIVLVGAFMASLDSFILIVAGPGIQTDLGASDGELQWILAGYQLTFAVFLITGGCLADLLGRRRMFITGMTLFTLASVACAVSPTAGSLVVARLVEGLGAALGLAQFGNRVGGVIGAHPTEHPGHLGVAHLPEQPVGLVRVELLEHVGLEFGVAVHPVEDFPAFVFVGVLQQVGDLRRFQGADPSASAAGEHALAVPDQRLEGLPVPARVPTPGFDQPEESGRAAGVEAGQHPPGPGVFQFDVIGMHQLRRRDVDEAVIEHIRAQQHLTVAVDTYTWRPPTPTTKPVTGG